jgi:hypothetical protein
VDGANLGFSLDPETQELRVQNRSKYISQESAQQFQVPGPIREACVRDGSMGVISVTDKWGGVGGCCHGAGATGHIGEKSCRHRGVLST